MILLETSLLAKAMYGAAELKRGFRQPSLIAREVNGLLNRGLRPKSYNRSGIDIFEEDWDNLIILDACRYDTFESLADLPGKLESRESRAASTSNFIEANFVGRELHDTVYVAGNSWIFKKNADANLHQVYDVVAHPEDDGEGKPSLITRCAKHAAENHPNKRLLVHYIRPHHPFLGETAQEIFSGRENQPRNPYDRLQRGVSDLSDETLRTLYEENLEVVLPKVAELLDELRGKTVVSADHGELLGESVGPIPAKLYGHHRGLHVDELVKVPWHVHENGKRRKIVEEAPLSGPDRSFSAADRSVDERLEALGYKV
jgi:hypothetical protein